MTLNPFNSILLPTINYIHLCRLPSDLEVSWPEGNAVQNNEKRRAGKTVGDIKVGSK